MSMITASPWSSAMSIRSPYRSRYSSSITPSVGMIAAQPVSSRMAEYPQVCSRA